MLSIDSFALKANMKLRHLIVDGNKIDGIPALFFSKANSLEVLSAKHQQIDNMDARMLENLTILHLDDNLIDSNMFDKILTSLPNLYHISVESNLLTNVTKSTFANQSKLKILNLWNNSIAFIEDGSLDHLVNLEAINLERNTVTSYLTECWHFCHSLDQRKLDFRMNNTDGRVIQGLKVDKYTDDYCHFFSITRQSSGSNILDSCSNDNGHLSCEGDIQELICDLKEQNFTTVTFEFPKDVEEKDIDKFYEAETNSYFREMNNVNGKSNATKYLKELTLYGTKFDLSTLPEHTGPRTQKVTILADTVFFAKTKDIGPLIIDYQLIIRARVVAISQNILMNMTRGSFFSVNEPNHGVDSWSDVQEIVSNVGDASFTFKRLGLIEIQQASVLTDFEPAFDRCTPHVFDVLNYHTNPSIFFDRAHLNIQRMAVRTLAFTKSNNALAIKIADHNLNKTKNPSIVEDKKAYIVALKLVGDRELVATDNKRVPFYSTSKISQLAEVMYDRMLEYSNNETIIMLNLDIALGRIADMNKNFEDAKLMRELYFERELQTLEEIFNSSDANWHWSFNASRDMEGQIQDSIAKNQDEMFQMEQNELEEMLLRARDTVISTQAIVDKFKAETDRYTEQAKLSLELQSKKVNETNHQGDIVEKAKRQFDEDIEEYKHDQMLGALFGFLGALASFAVGMATFNPAMAGAGIMDAIGTAMEGGGIGEAMDELEEIGDLMMKLVEVIESLEELEEMLSSMMDDDSDIDLPDIDGDIVLSAAKDWSEAMKKAYRLKDLAGKFTDMEIMGRTQIESVGKATDNKVDPSKLQQALYMYAARGDELIQETVTFADLMMHLADIAGELEAAETDLEIAVAQVERAVEMLMSLAYEHKEYIAWTNKHRDDYQNKCDEYANAYENATAESKEAFKKDIIKLFTRFKEAFEESNKAYLDSMDELTAALYQKAGDVNQQSMTHRSMMMNLYQDFCDGMFFFSFRDCSNEEDFPTMSDDFGQLLSKLIDMRWESISSMENLPNIPAKVSEVSKMKYTVCTFFLQLSQESS